MFVYNAEVCGFCRKPVALSEPAIEALNRTYHDGCFQCRSCHIPLAGKQYYNKAGIPLCEDCYQVKSTQRLLEDVIKAGNANICKEPHQCFACWFTLCHVDFTLLLTVFQRQTDTWKSTCRHLKFPWNPSITVNTVSPVLSVSITLLLRNLVTTGDRVQVQDCGVKIEKYYYSRLILMMASLSQPSFRPLCFYPHKNEWKPTAAWKVEKSQFKHVNLCFEIIASNHSGGVDKL